MPILSTTRTIALATLAGFVLSSAPLLSAHAADPAPAATATKQKTKESHPAHVKPMKVQKADTHKKQTHKKAKLDADPKPVESTAPTPANSSTYKTNQ